MYDFLRIVYHVIHLSAIDDVPVNLSYIPRTWFTELNSVNSEYFPEAHIQLEDEYFGPDELVEKEIMTVDERANTLFATDYTDNPVGYTKEELQGKITDGCGCSIDCYSKIGIGELYSHILSMKELEKSEKDMYIIGKLKCSGVEGNSSVKRKRYTYHFDDRQVCRAVFLVAHDCGIHYLRNVLKHMKENGAVPRTHGNEGRRPKHAFSFEDTKLCITFILNYAGTHGLPQPAAPCNGDGEAPILLPASCTKKELHNLYTEACVESGTRAGKLTVFKNIWNSCCGHIKIANPRFDVCSRCEYLKDAILFSTTENQKIESTHALLAHVNLARQEHNVYLDDCRRAKTELFEHSDNNNNPLTDVHYTADFAQCVSMPHRSRQPGPLYFLTCRKVQIFGICQEGRQQINYLIDENETIGKDGSQTHGPNAVISMLHHSLQKHSLGEVRFVLHCDNCPGQFKNRFLLGYLMWRVMVGLNWEIELKFQVPGHTRCTVDAGFAHIKKLYRRMDTECMAQLVDVVNKSARTNVSEKVNTDDFHWRDWKEFLKIRFKPLKGIRKVHQFRFSITQPGLMFFRESSADVEQTTMLAVAEQQTDENVLPDIIHPAGLSRARQEYFRSQIRPHVRPEFKDLLCPPLDEE